MPNTIKPKRSNTASKVPNTSELVSGELGVNMADRKVYINNGTSIVQVGAGLLNALSDVVVTSPTNGQSLIYNGTNWINQTSSAETLTTARLINGTSFNGSANITTANWGTTRSITIGATAKNVNGSANVNYTTEEILPTRLRNSALIIADWNDAIQNGWYQGINATNAPNTGWHIGFVESHNSIWTTQTVHAFSGDSAVNGLIWRREQNNGTWGSWYRLQWSQAEQDARYASIREKVNVISTNTNAVASNNYVIIANLTLTLPSTPAVGDWVRFQNASGLTTPVIGRNSSNIMSLAENLVLNSTFASGLLIYIDSTRGWVLN